VLATLWRFWYWPLLGAPVLGPALVRRGAFQPLLSRWFTAERAGWSGEDAALYAARLAEPARARASSKTYGAYLVKDSPAVLLGKYRTKRLEVPTKLLHGTADHILRPAFLAGYEPYADEMSLELVPDVGHFIAEEAPQLVAQRAIELFA
jgi:pimeloyl-ACP methyl ester carboxylesterase